MSGRIRTVKPEWLEDEKLCSCSVEARLMSVALILLADDYGNGRAHPVLLASQVFYKRPDPELVASALKELEAVGYIVTYQVRDQSYFSIRNWAKHQRVDKPGKPRVPGPDSAAMADPPEPSQPLTKPVYFIRGGITGLIKIGESIDPVGRLANLAACGSEPLHLLVVVADGSRTERELHAKLAASRVYGEWFRPTAEVLAELAELGGNVDSPIATAGYSDGKRTLEKVENDSENDSGTIPERFRTDLRPTTSTSVPPTASPARTHETLAAGHLTADAIDAQLASHPATAPLAGDPNFASTILGRAVAKGAKAQWLAAAIAEAAADTLAGDNIHTVAKRVRAYCDRARPPQAPKGTQSATTGRFRRTTAVQNAGAALLPSPWDIGLEPDSGTEAP